MNMTGRAFCVKIQLDLHAVTCPGVWLCPNGKISLIINTLNNNIESRRIAPVFPLLFQEKFTFEKTFTRVATLAELQRTLEQEFFFVELIQWITPTSRGIILATFETNLDDLLYPTSSFKGLLAGADIDLLTEPTKNFPGIISPKIEVSTKTIIEGIVGIDNVRMLGERVVNPKTINSKNTSCIHRKKPVKGILRQRRVCHSQERLTDQNYPLSQQKSNDRYYYAERQKSSKISSSLAASNDSHIFNDCPVCLKYKSYFSSHSNVPERKDLSMDNNFSEHIYQFPNNQNNNIIRSSNNVHTGQKESTKSMVGSKVKAVKNVNESYCKCEQNQMKKFYQNLEEFYKRMYEQVKKHAEAIDA